MEQGSDGLMMEQGCDGLKVEQASDWLRGNNFVFIIYLKNSNDRLTMEQGSNYNPTAPWCDGNDMTEILFSKVRSELVVCFHPPGGRM